MMALSISEVRPFRWIWDAAKTLFKKIRGQRTESIQRTSPARRDRLTALVVQGGRTNDIVNDLFEQRIDHQQWTLQARQTVKQQFIAQYMLGRGGRAAMTQSDWGRVGAMLKQQYQYLQRFEQDLIDGKLTEAQARVRLQMYIKDATQAHERALAVAKGVPQLPAYPGDGQTVCKANCQCHWSYEETENEWLCTWTLGAAEHCPDCLANASKWNPLRIAKQSMGVR